MIADRIRAALSAPDPAAFAALLHPDAHWGESCRNRDEVLAWYQGLLDQGVRLTVREIQPDGDRLLLTVDIDGPDGSWTAHPIVRLDGDLVIDIQPAE
ncbi:nuclear transport factor 2 family protein [Kutzneria chonburiensis]|uniref:Nuclear transport factor 2 family protein n=1 Tax=Kutzneria chonburiensis TaxID=1483604 RepID=A0ABV6MXV9_9PSEU|nr:nuclear transport factor 2 family protein [Kutzneria chonburiensis]